MDIQHGRRKSFDIEYVVVTEENIEDVAKWCKGVVGAEKPKDPKDPNEKPIRFIRTVDKNAMNTRQTKAFVNDLIVKHLELNSFKSFSQKSFDKSYEGVTIAHVDRDATTGEFVSEAFAKENPSTTVHETVTLTNAELPHDADPS